MVSWKGDSEMDDLGVIELEGPMDFDDLPNITKQKPVIFHNYFKLQGIASSQTMINHDLYVPQLGLSENTLHFMNCFFFSGNYPPILGKANSCPRHLGDHGPRGLLR